MNKTWAVTNQDNLVLRVEVASDEWVDTWRSNNQDSELRYLPTDVESRDYAGIGWTWDATIQRFIPPMPGDPGDWVYDPELWGWVDINSEAEVDDNGEQQT